MEQIKKKMAVLRENLADAESRADKAEAELKEANDRAANAETEVSSLTKELQQIEDELDAAESRLSSITEQLKTAEAQADESERVRKVLENRGMADEERSSQFEARLAEERDRAERAEKEYEEIANKINMLETELDETEARAEEAEEQVKTLEEEVTLVGNNLRSLEVSEGEATKRELDYDGRIKKLEKEYTEAEERANEAEARVTELEKEIGRLHGRDRCGKSFILVVLLIFFMAAAIVMMALYFSRDSQDEKVTENGGTSGETGNTPTPPPLCRTLPKPIAFNTLPKAIQDELNSLESLFEEKIKLGGPSAVTANIVYMDRIIWRGEYGVMNNSEIPKRRPTDKTVFPIASVSKVLTVLMLYKLHNGGFVNTLDDSVTDYQRDFLVKNPFGNAPITLRELASHRSGLPREAPCYPDTKTNFCPYTNDQMIQRLRNVTLLHEPGKEPSYSNLGFALLGQVLGQRFGNGYEEWMRNNILSTFDMSSTVFALDDSIRQLIPENEFSDPTEWGWLNPTGGAFSTVADFAKLEIGLFTTDSNNRYLSKTLTEAFFAPEYILQNGKNVIGTPWEMTISGDMLIRRKEGGAYGYDSLIILLPEMKLALNIFCANCGALRRQVDQKFTDTILPTFKEVLRKAGEQKIRDPPDTKQYIGVYRVEGLEPSLSFLQVKKNAAGNLVMSINGVVEAFILNYTEPLTFRIVVAPEIPCFNIFTLGSDNEPIVFDSPSEEDGLCDKFTMWGAAVSGRAYFYRDRNLDTADNTS